MANNGNLKPMNKRTKDERRAIALKGGKASGKARRENKAMRETLKIFLDMGFKTDNLPVGVDETIKHMNMIGKDISVREALLISMISKGMMGDTQAMKLIQDISGETTDNNPTSSQVVIINDIPKS